MLKHILAQQLYKLLRTLAPECVHNDPELQDVRTLIVNGGELVTEFATDATPDSAHFATAMFSFVRTVLVPVSLLARTKLTTVVLCFDAARPHPARVVHPLQRQEHCERFIEAPGKCALGKLLRDPARCASFYSQLIHAIAQYSPLPDDGSLNIVMDGLMDGPPLMLTTLNGRRMLSHVTATSCFPRWIVRSAAWNTADAADRIASWVALQSTQSEDAAAECMVQCANAYTLLKLLAWLDVQACCCNTRNDEEDSSRIWFAHRHLARQEEYVHGDSGTTRYCAVEANEYFDVRAAYAHLYFGLPSGAAGVAHTVLHRPDGGAQQQRKKLVTPLLAMLVLLAYDNKSCVADTDLSYFIAEILQMPPSSCRGMLRALVHCERAAYPFGADVDVCVNHAGFLHAMTAVMGSVASVGPSTVQLRRAAVGARSAVLLHRLYNAHLPWYEELSSDTAVRLGFSLAEDGRPLTIDYAQCAAGYSVVDGETQRKTNL